MTIALLVLLIVMDANGIVVPAGSYILAVIFAVLSIMWKLGSKDSKD